MRARWVALTLGSLAVVVTAAYPALDVLHAEEPPSTVARADLAVAVAEAEPAPEADPPEAEAEPTPEPDAPEAEAEPTPEADPPETEGDDEVWVGPPDTIPDCEAKLEAAGVQWKASRIPLHETKSGILCGAEQIVRYGKGPGGIRWGSPQVTCPVALGLARLEGIVQEEAERHFGRRVRRIKHMGTYSCRQIANYPGWVSEHSYANAIDIKYFELAGGKQIPVLGTYPREGAEPKDASGRFLQAVARRLVDERVFSVVLTPSFDRVHRNHFHLDMARYLVDGT